MKDSTFSHLKIVWTKPGETMKAVVENPFRPLPAFLIVYISVFYEVLNQAANSSIMETLLPSTSFALMFVLALFFVPFYYSLAPVLFRFTGKWFGGKASYEELQQQVVVMSLPRLVSILTWVPYLALFGNSMFKEQILVPNQGLSIVFYILVAIEFIISAWVLVIQLISLSVVQRFSLWRAFFNLATAFLVLCVIAVFIYVGVVIMI
ncbi:hypothetical protein N781_04770 [Pontibacillus halophilus JSM 076056 = DSM 19796]|uniref:Yip1 domain-containing protein n=1 Tax=Pontibacillus halophilus JSM 076056 = DSM 19796 TaxID=1385510 RepID=A0A0A5I6F9_9BACI|nr:YIP1 family protein [Pontibacillus halophilus]KGX91412.1 hypothetical protein N781_04770 [Pontibacillus halophilus JSM 076056 = DSM 19796]